MIGSITKDKYSRITINSYPRSGTNFLRLNLSVLLGVDIDFVGKHGLMWLGDNEKTFQVVVLRNPVEAIISAYAHGERVMPEYNRIAPSLQHMAKKYVEYAEKYKSFSGNIKFYDFKNLELAIFDIALSFIDQIPEDFKITYPKETQEFLPTMKGNNFYQYLKKESLDPKIFDEPMALYLELMSKVKTI
jgi:hypothetical protein